MSTVTVHLSPAGHRRLESILAESNLADTCPRRRASPLRGTNSSGPPRAQKAEEQRHAQLPTVKPASPAGRPAPPSSSKARDQAVAVARRPTLPIAALAARSTPHAEDLSWTRLLAHGTPTTAACMQDPPQALSSASKHRHAPSLQPPCGAVTPPRRRKLRSRPSTPPPPPATELMRSLLIKAVALKYSTLHEPQTQPAVKPIDLEPLSRKLCATGDASPTSVIGERLFAQPAARPDGPPPMKRLSRKVLQLRNDRAKRAQESPQQAQRLWVLSQEDAILLPDGSAC